MLERRMGPVTVSGTIETASLNRRGTWRITISQARISGVPPELTPRRIRIGVRSADAGLQPGRISLGSGNSPASARTSHPGRVRFRAAGLVSAAGRGGFRRIAPDDRAGPRSARSARPHRSSCAKESFNGLRTYCRARKGAIAAALTTGERGAIPETVLIAMRDAGLAHLLAISGLHFSLVAALLFGGLRAALAAVPFIALRFPIKKWAAAGALGGALVYLLISGASIPTQRAFIMLSVVLLAVMLDRAAISMRLVAFAAAAVLLIAPESLLGASFQMSFAAVIALVAFYETVSGRLAGWRADAGLARRIALYALGVGLTTLIAGLATGPYAIYHFNRFAVFGIVANVLAVPITGLWIMPCAILAFLLMPLELEALALQPMGWGIAAVVSVAKTVSSWPSAVLLVPAMPAAFLALATCGGLWLCLWRGRLRMLGMIPILAAVLTGARERPPDILTGLDPGAVAVRLTDGLAIAPGTRRFTREYWLRSAGFGEPVPMAGRTRSNILCARLRRDRVLPPPRPELGSDRPGPRRPHGGLPQGNPADRLGPGCPEEMPHTRHPDRPASAAARRRTRDLARTGRATGPERTPGSRRAPWVAQYWRKRLTRRP